METTSDKIRAVIYAVLVHALCILLAFSGMFWWQSNKAVQAAGEPIEAVFVDLGTIAPRAAPPRPRPPVPQRQAPPPPEAPPRPLPTDQTARDLIEQQRIDNLALQRAEEDAREQEEQRLRAEQIQLEEEQRREREAQEQREREETEQREQQQREAEEEQARLEAEAAAELEAAERAAQEAAEQEQRRSGAGGEDTSLLAQYAAAIQRQVTSHWLRPDSTPPGVVCKVQIIQIPGGEVLSANVVNPCNADDLTRRSIEAAVLRAQPLPYTGFESVFNREVTFTFRYQAP